MCSISGTAEPLLDAVVHALTLSENDSDWVSDVDNERSQMGYIIMFNGGAVFWKIRRQDGISIFTPRPACHVGQEVTTCVQLSTTWDSLTSSSYLNL